MRTVMYPKQVGRQWRSGSLFKYLVFSRLQCTCWTSTDCLRWT